MSKSLVTVEGVSKKFCRSLKKSLWYGMQGLGSELLGRRHGGNGELRPEEFWAVNDVTFELKSGECLGLIGANGAGKSTLLKMLNGLIKPDGGSISVYGKVGALIALGAGFSPVLSGRENIYVNAAVLGLEKDRTDEIFNNIVDYAEIGDFIDTPVQNYSSGMVVRLGFAIAAHINPDVLLIDEVLAVGDSDFRKKCYRSIRQFRENGAGIIIVSHDMSHLYNLCDRVLHVSKGRLINSGEPEEVIKSYYDAGPQNELSFNEKKKKQKNIDAEITEVSVLAMNGKPVEECKTGDSLIIEIKVKSQMEIRTPVVGVGFSNVGAQGSYLTACNTKTSKFDLPNVTGVATVRLQIEAMPLYPGAYDLIVTLNDSHGLRYDSLEGKDAIRFNVNYGKLGAGDFYMKHSWSVIG